MSISAERVFSLSCFEGLRLLRKHEEKQPDLTLSDLVSLVQSVEADALSLDLEASAYLFHAVERGAPLDGSAFYQTCIREVLRQRRPVWAKLMESGRKRFVKQLNPDERSVFVAAGLMVDPPSKEVVRWWDDISGYARFSRNLKTMKQARKAELLTLERERDRLRKAGICREPEWLGLDDNFAGYDVLTYDKDKDGGEIVRRLIEVKSTIASPPRFRLSRQEWQAAEKGGEAYSFHIWDMRKTPPELFVRSVADVGPHIPQDNGNGQWCNAEVRV